MSTTDPRITRFHREDNNYQINADDRKLEKNRAISSPLYAALGRALTGPIAFYFKSPIKLFRPPRASSWMVLQAIAESEGKPVSWRFTKRLLKQQGWLFIPKMVLPLLFTNAFIGATLFGSYSIGESYLNWFLQLRPWESASLAGALAGAAQSFVSCPVDNLKLGFTPYDLASGKYKSPTDYFIRVASRKNRFATLYKDLRLTMMRDIPGFALFFGTFEFTRHFFLSQIDHSEKTYKAATVAIAGALGALFYNCISFPLDHARPYIMKQRNHIQEFRRLYKQNGAAWFYRGMGRYLIRSVPPMALALIIYETAAAPLNHDKYT